MSSSITATVADYAVRTEIGRIPATAVERAKQVIFDEIACAYLARRSLAGELTARFAAQAAGVGEARIYATGRRVPASSAALANGAAGHGEEVDGAHVVGGHPGASIVHTAVAMAERQRSTGADLVNAVVLGYDVGTRVVQACGGLYSVKNRFGLHSDFLYSIGCAAAAGRLIGLDALRLGHAFGLAIFAANAPGAFFGESRHISKSLCNGQFAAAGVNGVLMSAAGIETTTDVLGAPYGVLHCWGSDGHQDAVTSGLGERFAILGANFKFMNAGYPIHAPVEAALGLVAEHAIALEDIESIYVGMPTDTMKVVDGRDMHNICLQDVLAAVLLQGGTKLRESPFPAVLGNPAFSGLRKRIALRGDAILDRDQPDGRGAIVKISTLNGHTHTRRIDHPRGHSLRGAVSWDELVAKWEEGLPECDVARIADIARKLDTLEDVGTLLDAFGTGEAIH